MISSESRLRVARIGMKAARDALRSGRADVAADMIEQSLVVLDREIEVTTAAVRKAS